MSKLRFGLIGQSLQHSFSQQFFTDFFLKNDTDGSYDNLEFQSIDSLQSFFKEAVYNYNGLNVTIPYKAAVIPFLDQIDEEAKRIGAVNTIKIKEGKLIGYNTDVYGFEKSLLDLLTQKYQKNTVKNALVLGTGGAAKAVVFILKKLGIVPILVSRKKGKGDLIYDDLDTSIFDECLLIVNTTPLGMFPYSDSCPNLPFHRINKKYHLYDLVYNPEKTVFLKLGEKKGAAIKNGLEMLHLQAEKSWEIWNEK